MRWTALPEHTLLRLPEKPTFVGWSSGKASFVPEGAPIPGFDVEEDFTRIRVGSHKIACLLKLSEEFALDADFALLFLCLYSLFVAVGI